MGRLSCLLLVIFCVGAALVRGDDPWFPDPWKWDSPPPADGTPPPLYPSPDSPSPYYDAPPYMSGPPPVQSPPYDSYPPTDGPGPSPWLSCGYGPNSIFCAVSCYLSQLSEIWFCLSVSICPQGSNAGTCLWVASLSVISLLWESVFLSASILTRAQSGNGFFHVWSHLHSELVRPVQQIAWPLLKRENSQKICCHWYQLFRVVALALFLPLEVRSSQNVRSTPP